MGSATRQHGQSGRHAELIDVSVRTRWYSGGRTSACATDGAGSTEAGSLTSRTGTVEVRKTCSASLPSTKRPMLGGVCPDDDQARTPRRGHLHDQFGYGAAEPLRSAVSVGTPAASARARLFSSKLALVGS
jgi:hypothetical protein